MPDDTALNVSRPEYAHDAPAARHVHATAAARLRNERAREARHA